MWVCGDELILSNVWVLVIVIVEEVAIIVVVSSIRSSSR